MGSRKHNQKLWSMGSSPGAQVTDRKGYSTRGTRAICRRRQYDRPVDAAWKPHGPSVRRRGCTSEVAKSVASFCLCLLCFPCLVGNASQKELHYDYIGNLSQDMSFEYWVVPNSCRTTLFREFVKMEETQFMVWELFHLNQLCIDS